MSRKKKCCANCVSWPGLGGGTCLDEAWEECGDVPDGAEVHYWDYEGFRAGVYTGPDFCCCHHKRKEPSK